MSTNISEIYPNKYLKAAEIRRTIVCKISEVEMATMPGGEKKPVIYFEGKPKGLVANKTNATVIAEEYGDDYTRWTGCEVELYTTPVTFQSQTKPAIRVRIPEPAEFDDDIPELVESEPAF